MSLPVSFLCRRQQKEGFVVDPGNFSESLHDVRLRLFTFKVSSVPVILLVVYCLFIVPFLPGGTRNLLVSFLFVCFQLSFIHLGLSFKKKLPPMLS